MAMMLFMSAGAPSIDDVVPDQKYMCSSFCFVYSLITEILVKWTTR